MANTNQTGFRPAGVAGNHIVTLRFPIDSGNSTNVFVGDVMANNAAGSVRPATADAGVTVIGVCTALYDSNGVAIGAPGSSVTTKYLAASTAGYADVALALPDAIFVAQVTTAIAATAILASVDHVAGTGDTTTARSAHELNGAALNTEAQCQILGIVNEPSNSWAADVKVYVRFLESMWGQVNPTTGV